jgi:DNA invertase Pin-like site-specific DNA recombinase
MASGAAAGLDLAYADGVHGGGHMKRVGIYLRVSTGGQTTENQRRELEAAAARSGWQVVGVYEDAGISGAKGRDKRPGFDRLLKDVTARKINMIAAWSVDRLGRNLQDLVGFLTELQAPGCDLYLHQQALDTSTPSGRAMFQMCGVFAEFERGMIRERVNAGLARAKERGTRLGRRPSSHQWKREYASCEPKAWASRKSVGPSESAPPSCSAYSRLPLREKSENAMKERWDCHSEFDLEQKREKPYVLKVAVNEHARA